MKKIISLLPVILFAGTLCSCGGGGGNKSYYIVDYKYNLEGHDGLYTSVVVMKEDVIKAPKDPEVEDYVFTSWYLDKACTKEYLRWGLQIDSDLTLYAKWETFESQSLEVKINKFQEKLASMGKDAVTVKQECTATVGYPGVISGSDGVFGVHDEYIYNRYKDITVKDYYQFGDDDVTKTHYGQEQFYIANGKFHDVYVDFEDNTQNESKEANYNEKQENAFFSIDYQNLFKSCENNILFYDKSDDYNEETFEYIFDANFTKLNKSTTSYGYNEGYMAAYYSSSAGTWVTEYYVYQNGIVLTDGVITSAIVQSTYNMYIGDEIYYYVYETSEFDFYYNASGFSDYTGEILPY